MRSITGMLTQSSGQAHDSTPEAAIQDDALEIRLQAYLYLQENMRNTFEFEI